MMRQVSEKLIPWLDAFNQQIAVLIENGYKATPTNAREGLANLTAALVTNIPEIAWVQDDLIEGKTCTVPVRLYHPQPDKQLPVVIFYHGGGGMAGGITVYDAIARKIANHTQHIVISVDYRLAPENPFPDGVEDAYTVVEHLWETLDRREILYREQLSIAGDSGGGALVATVSGRAQFDENVNIVNQVLIYPSLDYTMSLPSIEENAKGYLLESAKVKWYFDNYFKHNEDRRHASPLHGRFTPSLPKTLLFTAEFCPLRDEGIAYCEMTQSVGVKTQHIHFDDMIHAFLNMEDLVKEECEKVYAEMDHFLNTGF